MKTTTIFIALLLCTGVFAQEYSSAEYIQSLHEGTLIVKLSTRTRTINAMQELVDDPDVSPERRQRLRELIQTNKLEVETFNKEIVMAFDSVYSFSDVIYTYDQNYDKLKAGKIDGIFLNEKLQPDPAIAPQKRPFFVLRFGSSQPSGSSGIEAMVIQNDLMKDLKSPFPYYQRINDLSTVFGRFFPAPKQGERDAIRIVEKLNKKLFRFYNRIE